jgi:hypothetical protein
MAVVLAALGAGPWVVADTDVAALIVQARQLKQDGRLEDAQKLLEQALASAPANAEAHYVLAWVLIGRGQGVEGAKHLYEVVRVAPDSKFAQDARDALKRLGLPDAPAAGAKPPAAPAPPAATEQQPGVQPPGGPAMPAGTLVVDDMQGDLSRWIAWPEQGKPRLVADAEIVKQGAQSGKWDTDAAARYIFSYSIPHDWSKYGCLDLWIHSQKATGAVFLVLPESDNPATTDRDCLRCPVKVDWEGWKEFKLHERSFQRAYKPVGFAKIDNLGFDMEHWANLVKYEPGTVLRFGDVCLLPAEPPGERLLLFHADTDWGAMSPLSCTLKPSRAGGHSAEWASTVAQTSLFDISMPGNWSGYGYLNMWVHCAAAVGDQVVLFVESDAGHKGVDGFRVTFPLDWSGWKLLSFPLASFATCGEPMGWDKVTMVNFLSSAYGVTPGQGATLCFDDIWLSKQLPTDAEKQPPK